MLKDITRGIRYEAGSTTSGRSQPAAGLARKPASGRTGASPTRAFSLVGTGYSSRSALTGSIPAARLAGSSAAITADTPSSARPALNTSGSCALMPNNRDCSNRPAINAAGSPIAAPMASCTMAPPQDRRQHARPRGADRHPQPDLPRPPRHRVRGHAVESQAGEQQRDEPERNRETRNQALEVERARDLLVHR